MNCDRSRLLILGAALIVVFIGCLSIVGMEADAAKPDAAVELLFPEAEEDLAETEKEEPTAAISGVEKSLTKIEERLREVEERLGPTTRRPTLAGSFERRLENVERRMARIEQQLARLDNLEQRVRRLEVGKR